MSVRISQIKTNFFRLLVGRQRIKNASAVVRDRRQVEPDQLNPNLRRLYL